MKAKKLLGVVAAVAVSMMLMGSDSYAQGKGSGMGNSKGQGNRIRVHSQTQTKTNTATQVRPEGSQRRDGTFLTTGTTANGSTTRPEKGRGVMDGTGINQPKNSAQ